MTAALLIAVLVVFAPVPRRRRRRAPPAAQDRLVLSELLSLGVGAGMNLRHAILWSARYCHPALAGDLHRLLRHGTLDGLAAQLRAADGPLRDLSRNLGRALETGAALGGVLDAYVADSTAAARAAAASRMQRLPVKLLFPLTLLMLPGLVLIVAGPALIDVFSRFAATP